MAPLLVSSALALVLLGCGKLDRISDCRALARAVNPTLDRIETETRAKTPASYRKAAKEYKELATSLRKAPPSAAPAKALATEYAALMAEAEPPLIEYATALESRSVLAREAAERTLLQVSRRERALAGRIEQYCSGR